MLSLIGYRGTGKTTVARRLSLQLARPWVDADVEIELAAGKSIAAIFADDGEVAFRDLESRVAADLCRREELIVAWGGGVVLRTENRQMLRRSGRVAWLTASPATLWRRLSADATTALRRPNLTAKGGIDEIIVMLSRRLPLYRQTADLEVDTEALTPAEVADAILAWLDGSIGARS